MGADDIIVAWIGFGDDKPGGDHRTSPKPLPSPLPGETTAPRSDGTEEPLHPNGETGSRNRRPTPTSPQTSRTERGRGSSEKAPDVPRDTRSGEHGTPARRRTSPQRSSTQPNVEPAPLTLFQVPDAEVKPRPKRRTVKRDKKATTQIQGNLFDFDIPTDPKDIDPGGTPLPAPASKPTTTTPRWRPSSTEVIVPNTPKTRAEANIHALELLKELRENPRYVTESDQTILAQWSGWGAVPHVFENRPDWSDLSSSLRTLLNEDEYAAAEASTLNSHFTDPAIVAPLWSFLTDMGFTSGQVLEPGCGSGNFIAHAPDTATMIGIENDPVTAEIATLLFPDATIRTEGFEDTRLPEGSFTAAIGNVPFGAYALTDPPYNPNGHLVHDHFIIKSLRLTAPGGFVILLTSAGTLDKTTPTARREMASHGNLVAALRLPTGALKRCAGTDTIVDILIFQTHHYNQAAPQREAWEQSTPITIDGQTITVNEYFHHHPDHMLGVVSVDESGMYGEPVLKIHSDPDTLTRRLPDTLKTIADTLKDDGISHNPVLRPVSKPKEPSIDPNTLPADPKPGTIAHTPSGQFLRYTIEGQWVDHDVPASQKKELRHLLKIRDTTVALIDAQALAQPSEEIEHHRSTLNTLYDDYVRRHGPINRFKTIKGTGSRADHRRYPPMGGMRAHDPSFQLVAALEVYDEEHNISRKAPIFTVDILKPRTPPARAETLGEAVAIAMAETGKVDLDRIADLIGEDDRTQLVHDLHTQQLAFTDPGTGLLTDATTFLSGNVRTKLDTIEQHLSPDSNPDLIHTIDALKAVIPEDIPPGDISVKPGVTWIPASDYLDFIEQVFHIDRRSIENRVVSLEYDDLTGKWNLDCPLYYRSNALMTERFGTNHRDAITLFEASMNNAPVDVHYPKERDGSGGGRNIPATLAAQDKKTLIEEEFATWIFTDPDRRDRLVATYNRTFNSYVDPHYDGSQLTLPGLGETFIPRKHQRDAVARIINQPSVLLDHVVGAGKTGTMAMAAMELKRLGHASQPWIVVPNHLVDQISREYLQWFPRASILVAHSGMTPAERRTFVATTATCEWDTVIVPQTVFKAIPVSKQEELNHLKKSLNQLRASHAEVLDKRGSHTRIKALSRAIKQATTRFDRLRQSAGNDRGIGFFESGCDYLFIDEAHHFKNLSVHSATRELDNTANPTQKAEDLAIKLNLLRQRKGPNARIVTFGTATPVANSLRELYVMQSYLGPEILEEAGVKSFDTWLSNFARTVTAVEPDVTGTGFRMKTRIGQFVNLPELIQMVRQFSDVVTQEQIPVPIPDVVGGKRRAVILDPSPQVESYFEQLTRRAFDVRRRPKKGEDNMLKIVNDGRNAALDPRLVGLPEDENGGRIRAVADEIIRIHHTTAHNRYPDYHGHTHPTPGALQIVFLDRSTPKKDQWNVYDALKEELVSRGITPSTIRFIHDATNDAARGAIRESCNEGRINVLIASTEKGGTGLNVQARAVGLHHVDCPWRPADLEQREGRILRQGNNNPTVEIIAYATARSLDTYQWSVVERKQAFISSLRRGDHLTRTAEDITDSDQLSYAEIKAAASDNPLLMEQAALTATITRLSSIERDHHHAQHRIDSERTHQRHVLELLDKDNATLEDALTRLTPTTANKFTITIDGVRHTERTTAADHLYQVIEPIQPRTDPIHLGVISTYPITYTHDYHGIAHLAFPTLPIRTIPVDLKELTTEHARIGLIRRIENVINRLPEALEDVNIRIATAQHHIEEATANIGRTFDRADELTEAKHRLEEVNLELAKLDNDTPLNTFPDGSDDPDEDEQTTPEHSYQPQDPTADSDEYDPDTAPHPIHDTPATITPPRL